MEGYDVVTATNGAEALVAGDQSVPSLVVLGMRMPVLAGGGAMRGGGGGGFTVGVVGMAAAGDGRRWGREIGAEGVLAKPFDIDELVRAVQQWRPQGAGES